MRSDIRYVLPGLLRVSAMRLDGADPMMLQDQFNEFGFSMLGMPPIEVTLGRNEQMMINNGMTRATRCCLSNSERTVPVEVIDIRLEWDFSHLARLLKPWPQIFNQSVGNIFWREINGHNPSNFGSSGSTA